MQVHEDAVTDLVLALLLWLFAGWHGSRECITVADDIRRNLRMIPANDGDPFRVHYSV